MRNVVLFLALLAFGLAGLSPAQYYPRRSGPVAATANAGPYKGPAVTFHGTVKALTKKEIIVDLDKAEAAQDQESMTFRLSKKTKIQEKDKDIKPADIAVGTHIWVDATRDGDLKFSAVNVMVAPLGVSPEQPK
ncbi:MAG: hypothetical protein ABSH50_23790 [Bryobacteraceae bacterium]|jgi:hypothetical protein